MTELDPEQALTACQEVGLVEDAWIRDVRAGRLRIDTLTAGLVTVVTETGDPIALDGAATLYASYQKGGIELLAEAP